MESFNLEKALAGEPVQLRNGCKGSVIADTDNCKIAPPLPWKYPLLVVFEQVDGSVNRGYFKRSGSFGGVNSPFDIIGMWEEPRPMVQLPPLPAPLKECENGQIVALISSRSRGVVKYEFGRGTFDETLLEDGQFFASKTDAQAWIDAMREARR